MQDFERQTVLMRKILHILKKSTHQQAYSKCCKRNLLKYVSKENNVSCQFYENYLTWYITNAKDY